MVEVIVRIMRVVMVMVAIAVVVIVLGYLVVMCVLWSNLSTNVKNKVI